jgi:hypothetical protein
MSSSQCASKAFCTERKHSAELFTTAQVCYFVQANLFACKEKQPSELFALNKQLLATLLITEMSVQYHSATAELFALTVGSQLGCFAKICS